MHIHIIMFIIIIIIIIMIILNRTFALRLGARVCLTGDVPGGKWLMK